MVFPQKTGRSPARQHAARVSSRSPSRPSRIASARQRGRSTGAVAAWRWNWAKNGIKMGGNHEKNHGKSGKCVKNVGNTWGKLQKCGWT